MCWARRLTRVGLVGVSWALTWQHVGADVAARDIMTFFFVIEICIGI